MWLRFRQSVVAALGVLVLTPMAAYGATISVTTTEDPITPSCPSAANCSIRGAVAAGVAADGDVISIPAGTYSVTRGRINVDAALTFSGAGSLLTTINAAGSSPQDGVFRIRGSVRAFPYVTFRGLAITGGANTTGTSNYAGGGAITNNNPDALLTLDDVHLFGNSVIATTGHHSGGGAVISQGSVNVVNSTLESNTATVTDSGGSSGGGAILTADFNAYLSIADSTIRNNSVSVAGQSGATVLGDGGGAVHSNGNGGVTIMDSVLSGNSSTTTNSSGESGGGALYVENAGATINDSTFTGNTVNATATTDPSRPASNHGGGAIYLDGTNSALDGVTLSGNSVVVNGAASSQIGDSTNGGGAIYQYGYELSIANSLISANSVAVPAADRSGGGGLLDNGNSSQITNTTVQGNLASVGQAPDPTIGEANGGGGILFVTVRRGLRMSAVTIAGNRAPTAVGGGILVYQNPGFAGFSNLGIGGSIIAGNTSASGSTGNCATSSTASPPTTTITSFGYNLADDTANSCGFTTVGDVIANPQLGALADNGGPTATMALSASSPAVDAGNPAGCTAASGALLLDDQRGAGRPAASGGRCDIGAYELNVPSATTSPASVVTASTAMLTGSVANADAQGASAYFEYGTTTAYGSVTPSVGIPPLSPSIGQAAGVSGLTGGTTYHYRLVVRGAAGTSRGADQVFTTTPASTPGTRVIVAPVAAGPWRIATRVTVGGPGTLSQVGIIRTRTGRTIRVCAPGRRITAARSVVITCTISAARRRAVILAGRKVRLTTTFVPTGGKAVTFRNALTLPSPRGRAVAG